MAVAVEDAVVDLVFVMVLQQGDRIRDRIDRVLQRVIRQDNISLCIIQRNDSLAVVEAVAHHGVDGDRIGELGLLCHRKQAGERGGEQAGEMLKRFRMECSSFHLLRFIIHFRLVAEAADGKAVVQ